MRYVLFLVVLLNTFLFAKYVDLGTYGKTYKINEPDFIMEMKTESKKFLNSISISKIKEKIKESVEEQSITNSSLPYSKGLTFHRYLNIYTLKQNIYNPLGRLIYKKGAKLTINNPVTMYTCFIAGNIPELKNEVVFFDKLVNGLSPNARCLYFVSGISVLKLGKIIDTHTFYPTQKIYESRLKIKSYPTLSILKKQYIFNYTFSINKFKHKGK